MKLFHIILPLSALASALPAAADDFGLWTEASVQKSITKQFSVDAGLEFRTEDNWRQPTRWAVSAGASYRPSKYLSIGADYVFIHSYSGTEVKTDYKNKPAADGSLIFNGYNVDHGFWRNKHRTKVEITGKADAGRFTFSLRERYQYTHYMPATITRDRYRGALPEGMTPDNYQGRLYPCEGTYFTSFEQDTERAKRAKDKHYLRSRLQVEYNIRHCPLTPYLSYELSNDLTSGLRLDKKRLQAGAEWKVSKQHRIDFAYLYEDGADDDSEGNRHVICIGYKFKF